MPTAAKPKPKKEPPKAKEPHTPVHVYDSTMQRDDSDGIEGRFVDVVAGPHAGRFGVFQSAASHNPDTGYPATIIVRTRDADSLLLTVDYQDVQPSKRTGGR